MNKKLLNALPDIALFGAIFCAYLFDRFTPVVEIIQAPFSYAGWPLIIAGAVLTAKSITLLRQLASSDVTRTSQSLITHDLFAFSRNPLYASELLVLVGLAVVLGSLAAFAAPIAYWVVVGWAVVPFEEAQLRKKFGTEYEAYVRSVRRWM